jgi:hypothetical protein
MPTTSILASPPPQILRPSSRFGYLSKMISKGKLFKIHIKLDSFDAYIVIVHQPHQEFETVGADPF